MTTYSDKKRQLEDIARRTVSNSDRVKTAFEILTKAMNDLNAMVSEYTDIIEEVDEDAIANPLDEVFQFQKLEKDKLVDDFIALHTKVTAIRNAVGPLL